MLSRVEWLKYYKQHNNCSTADISLCDKYFGCKGCPYQTDYELDDLTDAAAEIFIAQLMMDGKAEDDGK